jgi:mono/diheme cytochrome c family protein
VKHPDFSASKVMAKIREKNPDMSFYQWAVYRYFLIREVRRRVGELDKEFDFINPDKKDPTKTKTPLPLFGPGRVDTWAPYKRLFVDPPQVDNIPGIVDFPSIWNQRARAHMQLHWDGNQGVLEERNIISALGGIGPRVQYLDYPRVTAITEWIIDLPRPRYQGHIDEDLAQRGSVLFKEHCADCHAPDGSRVGKPESRESVGTDDERIKAFTPQLAEALNHLGTEEWKLRSFKIQDGYANMLLDGIWLRAPYLHNGSVPTLRDLLEVKRPERFCRGNDVYDWKNLGFDSATIEEAGIETCAKGFFLYDTSLNGNSNAGHLYGTELEPKAKKALLEYLKRL